jgi:hypothetical protein
MITITTMVHELVEEAGQGQRRWQLKRPEGQEAIQRLDGVHVANDATMR